ncbi:hypothetical protein NM208_g11465 [Fusarium decemcellulare]|uniref:Uncharacterized protein n=1 Tax=Fusarium decemcellulare TaxID=57161 RepID=A0ACC1RT49_9HYPO|nr:hypothetical protein NM208_g11465 [Fusarium decemcellulare]
MWRLLPIILPHLADAFPANWNATTNCPQDALYTSLTADGGEFCSSVLDGVHCGIGYSTPAQYVSYNQTRISSYCECIVTDASPFTASTNSSRGTMSGSVFTTASASLTGEESASETSDSGRGGPGQGRPTGSARMTTSGGPKPTTGTEDETPSVSTTSGETTENETQTVLPNDADDSTTETSQETGTSTKDSWNSTDYETATATPVPGTAPISSSRMQNGTWATVPSTASWNQTQTTPGVTSDLSNPEMTRSGRRLGLLRAPATQGALAAARYRGHFLGIQRWDSSVALPTISETSSTPMSTPSGTSGITLPTINWNSSIVLPTINPTVSVGLPTIGETPTISFPSIDWNSSINVPTPPTTPRLPVPSFGGNSSIILPTLSDNPSVVLPTISLTQSIILPTISPSGSGIPFPFPSIPFPSFPSDSELIPTQSQSDNVVPGAATTSSESVSVPALTSATPTAATSGSPLNNTVPGNSNATATGASEFPAANFTHVTRTAALVQETCHTLARDPEGDATRRALLYNSKLREEGITIPVPFIESVEFESEGLQPLYLTVRDVEGGTYFVDISRRGRVSIADPNGYSMTLDAQGIHFSASNCTYGISIRIEDMYEQIASLAGAQCAAVKRKKRMEDMEFTQVLYMRDQCGNPVDRSLRQYPQLLVGDTVCADVDVEEETGRWEFDCTFPGSESGSMRCQWAVKNKVVDFITIDPFGGSCPDLSTVVTTLEASAQDILDPEVLREDLANRGLNERARQEADAAVIAYGELWAALRESFSKDMESGLGSLEEYINVYNNQRNFEADICQSLHAGEIPLNLSLLAGATRIPALTTLNWAPESTRSYNITVQDPSQMACCPNSKHRRGQG